MKKTCWTCNFFGKCTEERKVCVDWTEWDTKAATDNVEQFAAMWLKKHDKGFFKGRYDWRYIYDRRKSFEKSKSECED